MSYPRSCVEKTPRWVQRQKPWTKGLVVCDTDGQDRGVGTLRKTYGRGHEETDSRKRPKSSVKQG